MVKPKRKGRKLLIILLCLILAAGAAGGGWYYLRPANAEPVKVFSFQYLGMTEYWGDSQESYGYVKTEGVQTVYLTTTQTVTVLLVQPGDIV